MRIAGIIVALVLCIQAGCTSIRPDAEHFGRHRAAAPAGDSAVAYHRAPRLSHGDSSGVHLAGFVQPADQPDADQPESLEPPTPGALSSPPPTLDEFEQMALANNPTLVAAVARIEASQGRWLQVGLKPNPVVGYSGQQLGSGGTAEQQGVFFGQEFIRGGKLGLNRAIMEQEIARAEQELAAQEFRVLTDVRLAYYDFLIAVRRSVLADSMLKYARDIQADTKRLLDGGEAKRSDLLRAQIEARSIEIIVRNAEMQKQTAWKMLIAVAGVPELPLPRIGDAFKASAKEQLDKVVRRKIDEGELDRVLGSSPELAAAVARVEAARWSVDRAHAEAVPDVDVQAVLQSDNGTGSTNMNLQVSLPIPIRNANQGGIREAHANVVAAERTADGIVLSLFRRFEVAFQRYLNARDQVDLYTKTGPTDEDKGILVKAQESIEVNQRLHRAGEIKNLEMLIAQRMYTEANLGYLDSLRELWASILEIEGMLLKDSLP